MAVDRAYAIAIEPSDPLQREQVQAFIKEEAESWWHGIADVWIVTGKSASEWRDLVGMFFPQGAGSVIVLKLDTHSDETWFFRSLAFTDSQREWLRMNL
jgi:hypothetical protein